MRPSGAVLPLDSLLSFIFVRKFATSLAAVGGELYRKYSARGSECGAADRDWGYDRSSSKTLQHRRRVTVTEIPELPPQVGRDLP